MSLSSLACVCVDRQTQCCGQTCKVRLVVSVLETVSYLEAPPSRRYKGWKVTIAEKYLHDRKKKYISQTRHDGEYYSTLDCPPPSLVFKTLPVFYLLIGAKETWRMTFDTFSDTIVM